MDNQHEVKHAIHSIIRSRGHFPTQQEMCNILNYSVEQVKKCMFALVDDGFLEPIGDWYRFPKNETKELSENIPLDNTFLNRHTIGPKQGETLLDLVTKDNNSEDNTGAVAYKIAEKKFGKKKLREILHKPKRKRRSQYNFHIYIIQISMGIIGIGAAIISMYYTNVWYLEFLPLFLALISSATTVGFSVIVFEAILLFISGQVTRKRFTQLGIVAGLIFLWVIVTSFSMMTTISGQYNRHVANLRAAALRHDTGTTRMSWSIIQEQKDDLRKQLAEYRQQITTLNQILSGMSNIEARKKNEQLWNETQYRLFLANKNIVNIGNQLNEIRTQEQQQIAKNKEMGINFSVIQKNIPDFYGWLGKVLKVSADLVQFIMSLFLAIFVDIISPVGIAIALFLRNQEYV
jgi:hypothetical protein